MNKQVPPRPQIHWCNLPGLSIFLYMVAVHSVGRADACVVLWCQVKIFEALQGTRGDLKCKERKQLRNFPCKFIIAVVTL